MIIRCTVCYGILPNDPNPEFPYVCMECKSKNTIMQMINEAAIVEDRKRLSRKARTAMTMKS